ncbi:hypothetical protein EIN_060360 [Entamoeba invadens IP1]|uniref:hypothetical protein n=1 Tax=Entamoeba invadens IP1 TaxID=370355 RepID=UPI0002C3EE9D|nr:hypothetical protein EIN_060360 [Entamoeba invadens IP1]ELP93511.1 hypothetical protein EIN_060360 [Entamoeba invadens IP1]|eukprot:XP_004260282.1 hypothetical protein EIN_060360 [Entamoeba invadens IP1]
MSSFTNTLSAFKPVKPHYFEVIDFKTQNIFADVVLNSPSPIENIKIKSPCPATVVIKERKTKKYWTNEQKKIAVEKARVLGLSKATKFLQLNYPTAFADLSPSTLQYWIHKSKVATSTL